MLKSLLIRAAALAALLCVLGAAPGAEPPDRDRAARAALALADAPKAAGDHDRKARAALALAEARLALATAPPPKAKDKPKAKGAAPCEKCDCGGTGRPRTDAAVLRDTLVRVRRAVDADRSAQGSGIVVFACDKSLVVTAAHVVNAGTGAIEVRSGGKWHPARLLDKDDAADVAVLVVDAKLSDVAPVAAEAPRAGAPVLMLGCTSLWARAKLGADGVTLSGGDFYLIDGDPDQFSGQGDSGGGLFVAGELVGVVCGKVTAPGKPAACYCAKLGPVRRLLARALRTDGGKVTIVEPLPEGPAPPAIAVAPKRAALPPRLVINGVPHDLGPDNVYRPVGGCPNGRCPTR